MNLILKGEKISNHLKKYVHIDRKFKKRPVDDGTEEGEVTPKGKKTSSDSTEASEVDKVPIKRKVFSPKSELIEEPAIAKKVHKEPRMSFVLKKEEEDPIDYEKDIKIKKTPQKSTEKKERNTPETPEEKRKKLDLEPKPPKANFDSLLTSLLDDGKPKQQQPRLSSNLEALFKRNENGKISSGSKPVNSRFKDDYDIENDIVGRLFKGYD